ncbi:MAG: outer membrane lipoprotein-sorting protein [Fidelibacterota bacterium]|nr:MAG: outer membrane lipoprotein-sorting protein [Candidatus Neomarinimicrobiota bacterium]
MLKSHLNQIQISLPLLLLLLPCTATAQPETSSAASGLLQSVSQRMWGIDQTSTITATETNHSDSTRTHQFRLHVHYPQPADSILKQTFMEVVAPEKLTGQKYWLWVISDGRERTWIYLPRIGRLQEIHHRQRDRNRSREIDLSELNITPEQIESHTHQILESTQLDGHPVVLIKSIEKVTGPRRQERHSGYKLLWIDSEALLVRKAEIYSGRGKLMKCFMVEATKSVNDYTIATAILIRDAQRRTETAITVEELSLEPIREPRLFQPTAD